MRLTFVVAFGLVALISAAASAYAQQGNRAFCSLDGHGRMLCYYDRFEQCIESMRGVQGDCFANPHAAQQPVSPKRKKK